MGILATGIKICPTAPTTPTSDPVKKNEFAGDDLQGTTGQNRTIEEYQVGSILATPRKNFTDHQRICTQDKVHEKSTVVIRRAKMNEANEN